MHSPLEFGGLALLVAAFGVAGIFRMRDYQRRDAARRAAPDAHRRRRHLHGSPDNQAEEGGPHRPPPA